eukprot:Ihof_evm1s288 gene=Ihof_evmTU1s288
MDKLDIERHISPSELAARLTVTEVLQEQTTDPEKGLLPETVLQRRATHGLNEFTIHETVPLWKKYIENFKDPLIMLLLASTFISCVVRQWDDAISIFVAVIIVVTVGFVQEYQSEQSMQELTRLVPFRCHCIRNGIRHELQARDLVPGDLLVVSVGDRIPADMRFISVSGLAIDESMLTGETHDSVKHIESIEPVEAGEIPIADRKNIAFMGTLVRQGHGKGVVVGTGEDSEFGTMFHLMQETEKKRSPLQVKMDELGQKLTYISFTIIAVIITFGLFQHKPLLDMFTIGVSLAVAAIPEGLPIVVTVTLALGVIRMARRNAIVKKLPSVEALGAASVICADKTGTLTQNEMTMTHVYSYADHAVAQATGKGYLLTGHFTVDGKIISPKSYPNIAKIMEVGNLCNNSYVENGVVIGQATEGALIVAASKFGMTDLRPMYERTDEIPFSSMSKWMAVRCVSKNNLHQPALYYVKGMTECILGRCTSYYNHAAPNHISPLTKVDKESILEECIKMAGGRLRVIAFAVGQDIDNLSFVGLAGLIDPPRQGVEQAIKTLVDSQVQVVMITGDAKETALAIARQVGIYQDNLHTCMSGQQIESLCEEQLTSLFRKTTVFYRTSPRHKLTIIRVFQMQGKIVAMTGDGVNDAPALKQADIGIAMGKSGTDVSKEAADMILVDDNFSTILSAIEEGKSIFYNIKNFVRFQLSTSLAALGLVGLLTLLGYPNPLNAMQILWINIIMDGPPAQSLGVEPVDRDVMLKPPRPMNTSIITRALLQRVIVAAAIIILGTMFIFIREMNGDGEESNARATTMSFTAFVFFDMFNALACRSAHKSILKIGLFTNKVFLAA